MCTLILLHRPDVGDGWPLLLAANRDEMVGRPWLPPAAHWPDRPGVIGGLDQLAGGTWLAVNRHNVVAGVLNRAGSLGPAAGKQSRGELPLMAMDHATAREAAAALAGLDAGAYRSFNVVVADLHTAWFVRGLGSGPVIATQLPPGLSMTTASDPNDLTNPRVARHLPRFQAAHPPVPPDWASWTALLADSDGPLHAKLTIPETTGFATTSATLLALAPNRRDFRCAAGGAGRGWEVVEGGSAYAGSRPPAAGALPLDPAGVSDPRPPSLGRTRA